MTRRRGVTLVELLLVATLGAVVGTAGLAVWRAHRSAALAAASTATARLGALEVLEVAAAVVGAADAVRVAGDSALVIRLVVREGVACAEGRRMQAFASGIAPTDGSTSGDQWWHGWEDPALGAWVWVPTVDTLVTTARCPLSAPPVVVRVSRTAVLAAYHTGAGEWMLGWRPCSAIACGVIQPVVGPVRSRAAGGFVVRAEPGGVMLSVRVPGFDGVVTRWIPLL